MKTIAVVDDSVTNLKVAEKALEGIYKPILLKSGAQLLKYLSKFKPDMILLDIVMPEMDGFEVMQEIKKQPGTGDIPVIFLTGDYNPEAEAKGRSLGAVDFITKPFVQSDMLSRIQACLELTD